MAVLRGAVELRTPEQRWECPNCEAKHVTREPRPHVPFHPCRALLGLSAPYVPAGTRAEHRIRRLDDYQADELVQFDGEGRPVSSLETVRDDGQDCTVYAPTAHGFS